MRCTALYRFQVRCHQFVFRLYRGVRESDDKCLQPSGGEGLAIWRGGATSWRLTTPSNSRRSSVSTICTVHFLEKTLNSTFVITLCSTSIYGGDEKVMTLLYLMIGYWSKNA